MLLFCGMKNTFGDFFESIKSNIIFIGKALAIVMNICESILKMLFVKMFEVF